MTQTAILKKELLLKKIERAKCLDKTRVKVLRIEIERIERELREIEND